MFDEFDCEVVGFPSSRKNDANKHSETRHRETQTEFSARSNETQTALTRDVQSQTSLPEERPQMSASSSPPGLLKWLRRIVPVMMNELEANDEFRSIQAFGRHEETNDGDTATANLLQTIIAPNNLDLLSATPLPQPAGEDAQNQSTAILSLSWSSAGNTLAVSVGSARHSGWCQHNGTILVYKTRRYDSEDLEFSYSLSTDNCVTDVSFHPAQPALLASATVSGEVSAWNLEADGASERVGARSDSVPGHVGLVSQLRWLLREQVAACYPNVSQNDQIVISGGSDGLLIAWQVNLKANLFQILTSYVIHNGRGKGRDTVCDVSCFDFSRVWDQRTPVDSSPAVDSIVHGDVFMVGCSTGDLIMCRATTARQIQGTERLDPMLLDRPESHDACVYSLHFHPVRRAVYLTLAADMELRVYSTLQTSPLRVLCLERSLSTAIWAPGESILIVGGSTNRQIDPEDAKNPILEVFTLMTDGPVDVKGLDGIGNDWKSVTKIAINTKSANCVAVGDITGNVHIWKIPFHRLPQHKNF